MKDYKQKRPLFVYKHIMKSFAEQYTLKGEKIGLVEHSCGEPENYVTYDNFFKKILSFSHALNTYEGKGIYGSNSINWLSTDLGAIISGVTILVIHSKFSLDIIVNILNETKIEWLCLDLDLAECILNRKLEKIKTLNENSNKIGIDIIRFDDITKVKSTNFNIKNEYPDFVTCTWCIHLEHQENQKVSLKNYNFEQHLSYLPVSHIYDRIFTYLIFMNGGMINIWSKDMKIFSKDIRNSEDEIIAGVPKVFSRMYTNIITDINNLSSCRNVLKVFYIYVDYLKMDV
ncbi:acyl-CoA synthetase, putative [Plasmodium gaboni]|uniref:Acyl-CoA synthetase, putative n=1 Tax=Plasmodium gaboni TaxID=647221 RepID=A0ABY0KW03_9APIC|nr:acyl-CoA synthetase, putative [Plasmodium gaboni]